MLVAILAVKSLHSARGTGNQTRHSRGTIGSRPLVTGFGDVDQKNLTVNGDRRGLTWREAGKCKACIGVGCWRMSRVVFGEDEFPFLSEAIVVSRTNNSSSNVWMEGGVQYQ